MESLSDKRRPQVYKYRSIIYKNKSLHHLYLILRLRTSKFPMSLCRPQGELPCSVCFIFRQSWQSTGGHISICVSMLRGFCVTHETSMLVICGDRRIRQILFSVQEWVLALQIGTHLILNYGGRQKYGNSVLKKIIRFSLCISRVNS